MNNEKQENIESFNAFSPTSSTPSLPKVPTPSLPKVPTPSLPKVPTLPTSQGGTTLEGLPQEGPENQGDTTEPADLENTENLDALPSENKGLQPITDNINLNVCKKLNPQNQRLASRLFSLYMDHLSHKFLF